MELSIIDAVQVKQATEHLAAYDEREGLTQANSLDGTWDLKQAAVLSEQLRATLRVIASLTATAAPSVCRTCGFTDCPGITSGDCPRWPARESGAASMTSAKNCARTLSFWAVSEYDEDCPECGWRAGDHREPAV